MVDRRGRQGRSESPNKPARQGMHLGSTLPHVPERQSEDSSTPRAYLQRTWSAFPSSSISNDLSIARTLRCVIAVE